MIAIAIVITDANVPIRDPASRRRFGTCDQSCVPVMDQPYEIRERAADQLHTLVTATARSQTSPDDALPLSINKASTAMSSSPNQLMARWVKAVEVALGASEVQPCLEPDPHAINMAAVWPRRDCSRICPLDSIPGRNTAMESRLDRTTPTCTNRRTYSRLTIPPRPTDIDPDAGGVPASIGLIADTRLLPGAR
ncbi:MAG: hypothetical protein KJ749_02010 [Planctomycetes bacterium]|nr:hypothetical protein [Planctomycetota bacterium]